MGDFHEAIARANAEKRQRLQGLSDADLQQLVLQADQYASGDAALAQEELERRHPTPAAEPNSDASNRAIRSFLRLVLVLLSPFVGGFLGFILATAAASGWFTAWQPIENTPEKVARIVALDGASVWVEAASGKIYYNQYSDRCQSDCWVTVAVAPTRPVTQLEVLSQTCVGPAPLWAVTQILGECKLYPFQEFSTAYALRWDGRLFVWQYESGGEGPPAVFIELPCVGVMAGILAAILIYQYDRSKYQSSGEGGKSNLPTQANPR